MAKFTPRYIAPSKTDKRFINYQYGGYSIAIPIDKKTGYTIPNCVGYAHGRMLEILGKTSVDWKLPACNAEDFVDMAKKNGLSVGMTPKLGAIIVWRAGKKQNGNDGAGHVGVVEQIFDNGDITVSQSAYGGNEFYTSKLTKASGYTYSADRPLEGFVYCGIEFENPITATVKPNPSPSTPSTNLTVNSYPNYTGNKYYRVRKSFADEKTSKGSFLCWANAYSCWRKAGSDYHVYNNEGVQLDTAPAPVITLTADSYPNYTDSRSYRVRKSYNDNNSSLGSFSVFKNAFNKWNANKASGYHIYDANGKQLD